MTPRRIAPSWVLTRRMGRTLICLIPCLVIVMTSASLVTSFVIPRTSPLSLSSSPFWYQTSLVHKSYSLSPPTSAPSHSSTLSTRSSSSCRTTYSNNGRSICLHAVSRTKSTADSSQSPNSSSSNSSNSGNNNNSNTTKNLYEILGVASDADRFQLKRAYITLARQTHPDALLQKNQFPNKRRYKRRYE